MASVHIEKFITGSAWGRLLTPEQLQRVLADVTELHAASGQIISCKGARAEFWYGLSDGLVKASSMSTEGRSTTLVGVSAGGWCGEDAVFTGQPRRYDIVALRDSHVVQVPSGTFRWLLHCSLQFNHYLLAQFEARMAQFTVWREHVRSSGPRQQVAHSLAELFDPVLYPGATRTLQISQEELAFLVGLSRGVVNRALRQLVATGLIELRYGAITVRNLGALRSFAAG